MLKPEDFYSDANSTIFSVIFDLYKLNKPIDLVTVKEKLDDKKILDKIG
ncbi:DnaB-like helicase N-terminal domain-containing protein [Patescibacteria group bacterium]